nr:MAG TPA: hypothetical protein [Caudoviricetes sp.]
MSGDKDTFISALSLLIYILVFYHSAKHTSEVMAWSVA